MFKDGFESGPEEENMDKIKSPERVVLMSEEILEKEEAEIEKNKKLKNILEKVGFAGASLGSLVMVVSVLKILEFPGLPEVAGNIEFMASGMGIAMMGRWAIQEGDSLRKKIEEKLKNLTRGDSHKATDKATEADLL